MHDRDPHPVRMAAFPLGPWDYFRRDVQRIRNHSPAWLCWAFPRRCCRCAAGSPRSFASRKAKEKNPRLITFSCNCNVLHQIFSKFHPKYTKNYTGEIKHWQIYTVDLLQITILDVCVVLPSLYPFSTQLPSAPQWSSGSCPRHPSDQDGKEQFKHAII